MFYKLSPNLHTCAVAYMSLSQSCAHIQINANTVTTNDKSENILHFFGFIFLEIISNLPQTGKQSCTTERSFNVRCNSAFL